MDVTASIDAPCEPERLFSFVCSLDAYPAWLSILPRVDPAGPERGEVDPDEGDGSGSDAGEDHRAWLVELRGKIGPLARSKRLRMVRTVYEAPRLVRFERTEHDGRSHSAWVLDAEVVPLGDTDPATGTSHGASSRLVMRLHYGGSFGGSILEKMLSDEIEASKPRLLALVGRPPSSDNG